MPFDSKMNEFKYIALQKYFIISCLILNSCLLGTPRSFVNYCIALATL
jgi:hypothetical protein